jgi:hypothetical protein
MRRGLRRLFPDAGWLEQSIAGLAIQHRSTFEHRYLQVGSSNQLTWGEVTMVCRPLIEALYAHGWRHFVGPAVACAWRDLPRRPTHDEIERRLKALEARTP